MRAPPASPTRTPEAVAPIRGSRLARVAGASLRGALFVAVAGLAGALVASGSAGAGTSPSADYAREVTAVQMRSAELEQLLSETRDRVSQLEETMRAQGQSESERFESVEQVSGELASLRGRVEVLEFKLGEVQKSLATLQVSNERRLLWSESRLRQVEALLGVKPPPPPSDADLGISAGPAPAPVPGAPAPVPVAPQPAPSDAGTDVAVPKDAAGRLDLAIEHMRAGRQVAARAVLKQAIDENAGAPEMDEIRYRYAETFFNTGDYTKAITEFQAVITNHPKSDWACWSYFRQGESVEKLGKPNAKAFYQGATEGSCAKSAAAKEARKKL